MAEIYSSGLDLPLDARPDIENLEETLADVFDSLRQLASMHGDLISTAVAITIPESAGTVIVDTSVAAVTVTLPPADSVVSGKRFTIKPTDATYNLTIAADGSELIDGAATQVITFPAHAVVVSDNTGWWLLS